MCVGCDIWHFGEIAYLNRIKKNQKSIIEQLQIAMVCCSELTETLTDKETTNITIFNELEFLQRNHMISTRVKNRISLSISLRSWFLSLKNEKARLFVWRFYSKLPYGFRQLIKKV